MVHVIAEPIGDDFSAAEGATNGATIRRRLYSLGGKGRHFLPKPIGDGEILGRRERNLWCNHLFLLYGRGRGLLRNQ